jgi:hypothetical protein
MLRVGLAAAVGLGACWTGAEPASVESTVPARPNAAPLELRVKLERTVCFGDCPVYEIAIDGGGRVQWIGHAHVAALGHRQGKVSRLQLEELAGRLDRIQFFDRNEFGELPRAPECQMNGSMRTCTFGASVSICSDTSHTIITATRGRRSHRIDYDHCNESSELDELEQYIDRIANTEEWIAP